ncbi:MAG: hypothetical protein WC589_25060 [Sphingobacterium sp.]
MNLRSKTGPRFCADNTGASAAKCAGDKFKAAPDIGQTPREMARQIAKGLESYDPRIRLAAVDEIKDNLKMLGWVHDNTKHRDVQERTLQYIGELISEDVRAVTDLRAMVIVVEALGRLSHGSVVNRLSEIVVSGQHMNNLRVFRIIVEMSDDVNAIKIAVDGLIGKDGSGLRIEENVDALTRISKNRLECVKYIAAEALAPHVGEIFDTNLLKLITYFASSAIRRKYVDAAIEKLDDLNRFGTDFACGFEREWET